MSGASRPVYTIGHSVHTADVFRSLLEVHGIRHLADVRRFPGSRRHPHFAREALPGVLEPGGISYQHFPELGGRRRPNPDSINTAWRVDAFRGYADYMTTPAFLKSVAAVVDLSRTGATAVMCAEAKWWQCHRRLLADTLVARGIPVLHILSAAAPKPHELSEFAIVAEGQVSYPGLIEVGSAARCRPGIAAPHFASGIFEPSGPVFSQAFRAKEPNRISPCLMGRLAFRLHEAQRREVRLCRSQQVL